MPDDESANARGGVAMGTTIFFNDKHGGMCTESVLFSQTAVARPYRLRVKTRTLGRRRSWHRMRQQAPGHAEHL